MQDNKLDENVDINDVFNELLLSENRIFEASYNEGFEKGKNEENVEAYHLGYHRGAELGAEIGYFLAVTESLLNSYKNYGSPGDKLHQELTTFQSLLKQFPRENELEIDILAAASQIRARFKKICAVLKIQPSFPEADQLSF